MLRVGLKPSHLLTDALMLTDILPLFMVLTWTLVSSSIRTARNRDTLASYTISMVLNIPNTIDCINSNITRI